MKLIAGLGNPGRQYDGTRHNVGFAALLTLADENGIRVGTEKGKALTGTGVIGGEKVLLAMPQTYMNLSGESIRALSDYYRIEPQDIIILCDDINLEPGNLRLRAKGSAGGHNGLKSIIECLGSQEFLRVRIGVGSKPEKMDLADYVLGHLNEEEKTLMRQAQKDAAAAVTCILEDGMAAAMNRFNQKKEKKKEEKNALREETQKENGKQEQIGVDGNGSPSTNIGDIISRLFAGRHS